VENKIRTSCYLVKILVGFVSDVGFLFKLVMLYRIVNLLFTESCTSTVVHSTPLCIDMLFSLYILVLFCFLIISDVDLMKFVDFLYCKCNVIN